MLTVVMSSKNKALSVGAVPFDSEVFIKLQRFNIMSNQLDADGRDEPKSCRIGSVPTVVSNRLGADNRVESARCRQSCRIGSVPTVVIIEQCQIRESVKKCGGSTKTSYE